VRDERFGEIGRHGLLEAAFLYPTTTKKIPQTPCHSEMNCPFGITIVVEEGKVTTLVQTLNCYHNLQHKDNG
jgi:hypothetical protein